MIQGNELQSYETNKRRTKGLKSQSNPRQTKLALEILLKEVKNKQSDRPSPHHAAELNRDV